MSEIITGRSVGALTKLAERVTKLENDIVTVKRLLILAISTNIPQLIQTIIQIIT